MTEEDRYQAVQAQITELLDKAANERDENAHTRATQKQEQEHDG